MTVIIFLAVLFVLVLVHEWGHFITAKKTGMQVDEFAIGFPPKLFGKKIGETEYTLNALPIGGFVRIVGENAEDIASGEAKASNLRSFVHKPKWAQALVLVAGVVMNIVFAWLLYIIIFMMGVPTLVDETSAPADSELRITSVVPNSPAAAGNVPIGATVVALESATAELEARTPTAFQAFIATHGEQPLTMTYQLGETIAETELTPQTGVLSDDPERAIVGVSVGLLAIERYGVLAAVREASVTTVENLALVTVGLVTFFRDAIIGSADFNQVAGPVGIAGMVGDAAAIGFTSLLLFTAIISLNLAVINLLPFPALDGGRLVMVAIEAVTRRPINPVWVMRVNALGFILLILLMVLVTYNDIVKLL